MEKIESILNTIEENRLIAVIKSSSMKDAEAMIEAAAQGGVKVFELSVQTPQVFRLIETYANKGLLVGAGSVTDGEMAQKAINSGARYISTPYTDKDVIAVAKHNGIFVIQGAVTPTEIINAYQLGADLVMVYPIVPAGGPQYIRALRSAVPSLKIIAAGGVNLESVFDYFRDCIAVCIKQSLFEKPLVRDDNWKEITERARLFNKKIEPIKAGR